jgi:uncharacterized protein YukJ
MPLKSYGVLKGSATDRRLGSGQNPHYQVHLVDDSTAWRIAVNVQSKLSPSELEYAVVTPFLHPVTAVLEPLPLGWNPLPSRPGGAALDFIRGNLFDPRAMVALPFDVPGPDNDLNDKVDHYVQRAMADEDAVVYAFGERWGPEERRDKIFGFEPGNGVHDIHMNQGNAGQFARDDGVWQDGALVFHFPAQAQWVGVFLKFQSQTWHTDDTTGHAVGAGGGTSGPPGEPAPGSPFEPGGQPTPDMPDGTVRVVAALVNPVVSPEVEFVTLLNTTNADLDLTGWSLADRDKNRMALDGRSIAAGETLRVQLEPPVVLPNGGGIITVINADGLRVDGVSYTREQAANPGWTLKF